jgi:hypothetical protein
MSKWTLPILFNTRNMPFERGLHCNVTMDNIKIRVILTLEPSQKFRGRVGVKKILIIGICHPANARYFC